MRGHRRPRPVAVPLLERVQDRRVLADEPVVGRDELDRMLGVVVSPAGDLKEANVVMLGWALTVVAYLGCCFLTVLAPMPRLGITPEVVQRQAFTGGGLWIDQPHTAIAFGFCYFLVVGLGEILLVRRVTPAEPIRT